MALIIKWNVTPVKTANYSAGMGDCVRCDPSGGGFTVTLPAVTSADGGRQIKVKNTTSSTNTITIAATGSATLEVSSISAAHGVITFIYDGNGTDGTDGVWMVG